MFLLLPHKHFSLYRNSLTGFVNPLTVNRMKLEPGK